MDTSSIRNQLLLFFRQMHFNNMPDDVMARFKDFSKNDDFTKNMENWKKDLLDQNGNPNDLPDLSSSLSDDEWKYLYKVFRDTFRSMDENKDSFLDDKKVSTFFNDSFGPNKLFSSGNLSPRFIQELSSLYNKIEQEALSLNNGDTAKFYKKILGDLKRDISSNLLNNIKTGNININDEKDIQKFLSAVRDSLPYDDEHQAEYSLINDKLYDIGQILEQDREFINQNKLEFFKENYKSIFKTLYTNKNIRNTFSNNGGSLITNRIERAVELTDYDNEQSEDYIPSKKQDKLTFSQELKKWKDDTYEDYLEKYMTLKGDRLFISFEAKNIVKAISSAKIKPTDGLAKILDESGKIKSTLKTKSPKSLIAFKYFEEILSDFKETMPKAFNGALKNGSQLRAVVSEMIISAIKKNKVHEAKVAMEILAIVRYGYTTSKTMDALSKDSFQIFSDKGLSWNKNEGVQYVTKAFDKTLKFATLGIGYGITALSNSINRTGTKFKGASSKLRKAIKQSDLERDNNIKDLKNKININQDEISQVQSYTSSLINKKQILDSKIQDNNTQINNLNRDVTNLDNAKSNLNNKVDQAKEQIKKLTDYINKVDEQKKKLEYKLNEVNAQIQEADNRIQFLNNKENMLNDKISKINDTKKINRLNGYVSVLESKKNEKINEINNNNAKISKLNSYIVSIETQINKRKNDINNANNQINNLKNYITSIEYQINTRENRIERLNERNDKFQNYVNTIENKTNEKNDYINFLNDKGNELNDNLQDLNAIDNLEKYKELMAYWDLVVSTKLDSFRFGSKKLKQKMFDLKKQNFIQNWNSNYQMVA